MPGRKRFEWGSGSRSGRIIRATRNGLDLADSFPRTRPHEIGRADYCFLISPTREQLRPDSDANSHRASFVSKPIIACIILPFQSSGTVPSCCSYHASHLRVFARNQHRLLVVITLLDSMTESANISILPTLMAGPSNSNGNGNGNAASNNFAMPPPPNAEPEPPASSERQGGLPPLESMRAYRACLNCRSRKSKCYLEANGGRPVS